MLTVFIGTWEEVGADEILFAIYRVRKPFGRQRPPREEVRRASF
ncbi:hypothetical protein SAMN05518861_1532 [Mesorhizobium sp. YR577]|nr:hypothetical protein SAMN05518861_1532 [Mesorhizobium sp. YR577]